MDLILEFLARETSMTPKDELEQRERRAAESERVLEVRERNPGDVIFREQVVDQTVNTEGSAEEEEDTEEPDHVQGLQQNIGDLEQTYLLAVKQHLSAALKCQYAYCNSNQHATHVTIGNYLLCGDCVRILHQEIGSIRLRNLETILQSANKEGQTYSAFRQEVREALSCPVCFEAGPLVLCGNGHGVCADCVVRMERGECPICRAGYTRGYDFVDYISATLINILRLNEFD